MQNRNEQTNICGFTAAIKCPGWPNYQEHPLPAESHSFVGKGVETAAMPPALCFRSTSVSDLGCHALCKKGVHTHTKKKAIKQMEKQRTSSIGAREDDVHGVPVLQRLPKFLGRLLAWLGTAKRRIYQPPQSHPLRCIIVGPGGAQGDRMDVCGKTLVTILQLVSHVILYRLTWLWTSHCR